MNVSVGEFVHTAGFVLPQNSVRQPNIPETGNAIMSALSMGCAPGASRCSGRINGMGEFEIPFVGATVPGQSWMYLLGVGLIAGLFLMNKGRGRGR
ncbi:hypothetical protein LCGC14_2794490 [marine sediment metagenome]|uniref:Uncharacterized protein n=1 Tax=marine sediment metagenome TaxID=412755 RepID=A0A0F8YPH1_9ZZZZ